jgi:CRISPR/Cas system-associated exonuclease Cas4 (RecB family)
VTFLEKLQTGKIRIRFEDQDMEVKLKGFVDRIDRIGEEWRIIDYKSGSVASSDLKFKEWSELKENSDKAKAVQLYMYALLFANERTEKTVKIRAGIISLRKLNEGFLQVHSLSSGENKETLLSEEDLTAFENILKEILEEIYDFSIPFMQTEDVKRCENCDFVNLCNR